MSGQLLSKRRQRRVTRLQRRAERKPTPTYANVRENTGHFSQRMRELRNRTAITLLRRATEKQKNMIAEKLTLPWKWYANPEPFFNEQKKEDPLFGWWKNYLALKKTPHFSPQKRAQLKNIRSVLRIFTNPQVGFFGELTIGGKRTVVAIVGRDMTPQMITRQLKEYLLMKPNEIFQKMGGPGTK